MEQFNVFTCKRHAFLGSPSLQSGTRKRQICTNAIQIICKTLTPCPHSPLKRKEDATNKDCSFTDQMIDKIKEEDD